MGRFWEFLRNEQNRLVLGWLGGGLVVAATGAWVAFIYFFPLHKTPDPSPASDRVEGRTTNVDANCGSIAVGGNVSGSTITAGGPRNAECAAKSK